MHLWLPQASPVAWDTLRPVVEGGPVVRAEDPAGRAVRHPLLSSLGRDSRELQRALTVLGPREQTGEATRAGAADLPDAPGAAAARPARRRGPRPGGAAEDLA